MSISTFLKVAQGVALALTIAAVLWQIPASATESAQDEPPPPPTSTSQEAKLWLCQTVVGLDNYRSTIMKRTGSFDGYLPGITIDSADNSKFIFNSAIIPSVWDWRTQTYANEKVHLFFDQIDRRDAFAFRLHIVSDNKLDWNVVKYHGPLGFYATCRPKFDR
jgi:hypothetical protein